MNPTSGGGVDRLVGPACGALVLVALVWLATALVLARRDGGAVGTGPDRTDPVRTSSDRTALERTAVVRAVFVRPGLALLGVVGALATTPTASAAGAPAGPATASVTVPAAPTPSAAATVPGRASRADDRAATDGAPQGVTDSRRPAPSLWPVGGEHPSGRVVGRSAGNEVVVRRGDTLWSLAAGRLPPGALSEDVLRAVHQWHRTNEAVIGPDPDLILPGQVLRVPTGAGTPDRPGTG